MAELLCILYKLQYRFYSNYFLIDFSVFCTSGNFRPNEWQVDGKVWQNEEMFVAVTARLAVDFVAHLVSVWFSDVSVSFHCVLHQALQEQKHTGRQRYEELFFIFWIKHIFQLGVCRKTCLCSFCCLRSSVVQFKTNISFISFTDR